MKNTTGVDASKFVKKVDLPSLKSNVDKLDDDKVVLVPNGIPNGISGKKFKKNN